MNFLFPCGETIKFSLMISNNFNLDTKLSKFDRSATKQT